MCIISMVVDLYRMFIFAIIVLLLHVQSHQIDLMFMILIK